MFRRSKGEGGYFLQATQAAENVLENSPFDLSLEEGVDVLPVTAPAPAEVGAPGLDPPRRRFDDSARPSERVVFPFLDNLRLHLVARHGEGDKDDLPSVTRDSVAFESHRIDVKVQKVRHSLFHTTAAGRIQLLPCLHILLGLSVASSLVRITAGCIAVVWSKRPQDRCHLEDKN